MTTAHIDTDVVTLSLIRGALASAVGELESLIDRTSMSPFINEKKDYLVGFADAAGRCITLDAPIAAGASMVEPIFEHYPREEIRRGDLYWYNDSYGSHGAVTHSPDMVFIAPAFSEDLLLG